MQTANIVYDYDSNIRESIYDKTSAPYNMMMKALSTHICGSRNGESQYANIKHKQSYIIPLEPASHVDEFFNNMETCRKEGIYMNFTERQFTDQYEYSGIMIDLDIYQNVEASLLNHDVIIDIIDIIAASLHKYLIIPPKTKISAITLKRKNLSFDVSKSAYKDGVHILIPEVMVTKHCKKSIILDIAQANFADIIDGVHITNPKLVDEMSYSVPVVLFGSCKVGSKPYDIWCVHEISYSAAKFNVSNITDRVLAENYNFCRELALLPNSVVAHTDAGAAGLVPVSKSYPYKLWLRKKQYTLRDEYVNVELQPIINIDSEEDDIEVLLVTDLNTKYIQQLLELLDDSYCREYQKWRNVIYAIADCSKKYKPLAEWFSRRCPEKFDKGAFDTLWGNAIAQQEGAKITIRSLIYWAKLCNPEQYEETQKRNYKGFLLKTAIDNDGTITQTDIAKLLYNILNYKYVCDTVGSGRGKSTEWYEFVFGDENDIRKGEQFKWRYEIEPFNINLFIQDKLTLIYVDVMNEIKNLIKNAQNDNHAKFFKKVELGFKNSKKDLGKAAFQRGIIDLCRARFMKRDFIALLDQDQYIMGVGNGVLELPNAANNFQIKLINKYHEYKISLYTPVDYVPFTLDNTYIGELLEFIHRIYPEPDVFEYMLMFYSTGLEHKSPNLLFLGHGGGSNGKSTIIQWVNKALGNKYCKNIRMTLLTSPPEKPDSANSARMQLKGLNMAWADESDVAPVLNTMSMKMLVSPGMQSGRGLHKDEEVFKNTATMMAISNYQFIIQSTDHGTWRRTLYYHYKSKFTSNPDPTNKYEFKADSRWLYTYIEDPRRHEAMLSILTHYYHKLQTEYGGDLDNVKSPTIKAETEAYRATQDNVHRFITQFVVYSPNTPGTALDTIAERYKIWYERTYNNNSKMTISTIHGSLKNSCLQKIITKHKKSQVDWIDFVRLKVSPADDLLADETDIITYIDNYKPKSVEPPVVIPAAQQS